MAERKAKRRVRCEDKYVYDRLSSQKLSQVYHWLVPDVCDRETAVVAATHRYEESRSHLRTSVL
jgi:hypothetical protein